MILIDKNARQGSVDQWTQNPCGSVDADHSGLEYFQSVERNRYSIQNWMQDYFDFRSFNKKNVLEIGVGHGTDMLQFAKNGANCFGADITQKHIDLATRHLHYYGYKYSIEKCDATDLSYSNSSIDLVYSFGVLHHIPEIEQVISEITRVLKPRGCLQLALYYRYSAFHLVSKLIAEGLFKGKLFTLGYRGLMSTIETGADGINIKPFVTTYSKYRIRKLFSRDFVIDDISVFQLEDDHFYLGKLGKILLKILPFLRSRMGWYVTLKARLK